MRRRLLQLLLLPVLLFLLSLSGCLSSLDKSSKATIDASKVIEESRERVEKSVAIGPDPHTPDRREDRNSQTRRTFIGKEEKSNYLEVSDDDVEKVIFPITLNLSNVEIRQAFHMLSTITNKNILVGDEVEGVVTAHLKEVPWDKALDALLKMKDLSKHVDQEANIIRIHQRSVLSAQEAFARQRAEDLQKTLQIEQSLEPLYTEIFNIYYADPADIKSELEEVLAARGGGDQVKITVDNRIRVLVVQGTRESLDLVENLIRHMDTRTKQIFIEAYIVEVDDDFDEAFGARLGAYYKHYSGQDSTRISEEISGVSDTTTYGSIAGGFGSSGTIFNIPASISGQGSIPGIGLIHRTAGVNLKMELTALEVQGLTKIISNPRIFTLDNTEAYIEQGEEVPVNVLDDAGNTVPSGTREVKIKLRVTPSIIGDGNLILALEVSKDSINETLTANAPIDKRLVNTKLLVQDQSTIVIGGIYTQKVVETEKKVPLLGDIPLIGNLFKNEASGDQRKELMIFISPYII